ncbi:MAG: HAD family phosphatase, partial [Oscillospiraceae bacterium]|nr:HAD family phosphatase [Oscillospiraceae bacterium]
MKTELENGYGNGDASPETPPFCVIFDMDGVIFDSERTLLESWLETAERYGVDKELVRDTYVRCIGTNRSQTTEIYSGAFLPVLGEKMTWRLWEESFELHRERYADSVLPLKAGVREILEYLQESGVPVGIASSSRKSTVEQQIGAAGLAGFFVGCVGGDAVKISKPDPEIYRLACRTFGFKPARTFAIEDSFNGIRSANAAGLKAVMVPDLVPADDEMRRLSVTVCGDLF